MFEKHEVKETIKPIDGYNGKYLITVHGDVLTNEHKLIKPALSNSGDVIVALSNGEWMQHVNVAKLVIDHYKFITNPYVLEQMIPFHIDGDKQNNHASNLGYKFKLFPLEHETIKGRYYIPGYPNRLITKDGIVYNFNGHICKLTPITPSKSAKVKNVTGGYLVSSIDLAGDVSISFSRHRAMLLAFKYIPDNIEQLVANHIDGVPGNDTLDNLEWVTRQRNNIHAVETGLRSQNKPVYVKHVITGEVTEFASVALAARMMNVSDRGLNQMLNDRPFGSVNSKGYQIKYKNDDRDWVLLDDPLGAIQTAYNRIGLKVRDCKTMKVVHCESIAEASTVTGVKTSTIKWRMDRENYSPLFGYQFIPDYLIDFPDFTDEEYLSSLKPCNSIVYLRNLETGEEFTINSISKATKFVGVDCHLVLRRDGQAIRNGYLLSLKPFSNNI